MSIITTPQPSLPYSRYLYELEAGVRTSHGVLADPRTRRGTIIRGTMADIAKHTMGQALEPALYVARIECQRTGDVTRAIYDRRDGRGGRWFIATRGPRGHFVLGDSAPSEHLELRNTGAA